MNPFRTGTDDVKINPALKELNVYNGCRTIILVFK